METTTLKLGKGETMETTTEKKTYPKSLVTPIDIQPPYPGVLVDCGLTLVHDCTGQPRNYLHEISVRNDTETMTQLFRDGYKQDSGHKTDQGVQIWHFSKQFGLDVATWTEPTC